LTPQYAGLRTLQETFAESGFTVLAFPCNQFGAQEPGSDAEIVEFATTRYQANFPMFSKVEVNGAGACELYRYLKRARPDEEGNTDIPWNFTKFLVDGDGDVLARFAPTVTPEEIAFELESVLG
jgi:glutathione peroxidase